MPTFQTIRENTANGDLVWLKGQLELLSIEQKRPTKRLSAIETIFRKIRVRTFERRIPMAGTVLRLGKREHIWDIGRPPAVAQVKAFLLVLSRKIKPPADYILDQE